MKYTHALFALAVLLSVAPGRVEAQSSTPDSVATTTTVTTAEALIASKGVVTPYSLATLCTSTGGNVSTGMACASADDFPSSCAIGPFGCAPSDSHLVSTCECPSGQCFDPAIGCTYGPQP